MPESAQAVVAGAAAPVKRYGAHHYIDRIMGALSPEMQEDFRFLLGGSDASRDAKITSLLLVEVLDELRILNKAILVSKSDVEREDPVVTELKTVTKGLNQLIEILSKPKIEVKNEVSEASKK